LEQGYHILNHILRAFQDRGAVQVPGNNFPLPYATRAAVWGIVGGAHSASHKHSRESRIHAGPLTVGLAQVDSEGITRPQQFLCWPTPDQNFPSLTLMDSKTVLVVKSLTWWVAGIVLKAVLHTFQIWNPEAGRLQVARLPCSLPGSTLQFQGPRGSKAGTAVPFVCVGPAFLDGASPPLCPLPTAWEILT
jgi:hypothetical protein